MFFPTNIFDWIIESYETKLLIWLLFNLIWVVAILRCKRSNVKKVEVQKVFKEIIIEGTWQSKIYEKEKGNVKIVINTENSAVVTIEYDEKSDYQPGLSVIHSFDYKINKKKTLYLFRQTNFTSEQYITMSVDYVKLTGFLTSNFPHDIAELKFKKG